MQPAVEKLVQLGRLPESSDANVATINEFEQLLQKVQAPISNDEARALVKLFGADDCFGLAWALLHLVETAPAWPIWDALDGSKGEWIDRLRERTA